MTGHRLVRRRRQQHHHTSQQLLISATQQLAKIRAFPFLCWSYLLTGIALLLAAWLRQRTSFGVLAGGIHWAQVLTLGLAVSGLFIGSSGVFMLRKHRRSRLAATISLILLLAFCGVFLIRLCYIWIVTWMRSAPSVALQPAGILENHLHEIGSNYGTVAVVIPLVLLLALYVAISVRLIQGIRLLFRIRSRHHIRHRRKAPRVTS